MNEKEPLRWHKAKEAFFRDFVSEDTFEGVWLREAHGRQCAVTSGPNAHEGEPPLADVVNVDYEDDRSGGVAYCLRCFAALQAECVATGEGLMRSTVEEAWERWEPLWFLFLPPGVASADSYWPYEQDEPEQLHEGGTRLNEDGTFTPDCECGWVGEPVATPEEAFAQREEHSEEE